MRNLINKEYMPLDNSYSLNLSDIKADRSYLAGVYGEKAQIVTIVCNPFDMLIKSEANKKFDTHKFILVRDFNGHVHTVLFHTWRVITDKNRESLFEENERQTEKTRDLMDWDY